MRGPSSQLSSRGFGRRIWNTSKPRVELKGLMPEDTQQAIGYGVRAKRSKSGAVSFDLLNAEDSNAAVQ